MDSDFENRTRNESNNNFDENLQNQWSEEQVRLASQLIEKDDFQWSLDPTQPTCLKYVGGMDISFVKENNIDACACLVVLTYPNLEVVYEKCQLVQMTLPYISGFLAFREVPFLLQLLQELKDTHPQWMPQVILVDGNGKLHHRGFGLACHLGVLTGIPTVGVSKTLLNVDGLSNAIVNKTFKTECERGGQFVKLIGNSGVVHGAALRSTDKTTNPIFVSVGHKISLETAVKLVSSLCKYRIPEPIRQADQRSRAYLREKFPHNDSDSVYKNLKLKNHKNKN